MAAVHSPETQGHRCIRSEELEEPGSMTEKDKPESTFVQLGANEDTVIPDDSFPDRESIGGNGFASQTEPLSKSAEDDVAAKDNSVVDLISDREKAVNTNMSSEEHNLDRSETEEDTGNTQEPKKDDGHKDDEDKAFEMQDVSNAEDTETEKSLSDEEMSPVKGLCKEPEGEEEEGKGGRGEEKAVEQRKGRIVCKECGKRFNRRETYNLHRHVHTHKDELATLTCKECGLSFQHRSSLIKHRSEHREKEEQAMNQPRETQLKYQCEYCRTTFATLAKMKGHVCNSGSGKPLRWIRNSELEKPFRCPLCRKEFLFKWCMTKHIRSHSIEVLFHCQECRKSFTDRVALLVHQRYHSATKPGEFPDSGKHQSVTEDNRRKHTQPTRLHQCRICSKTFKYSSLLHQHQYLHTGQKPFRCLVCGKTFAFSQNLKIHCRQHKLSTHACQICPLSFSDRDSLQAHVISHETVGGPGKENSNQGLEPKHTFNCPLCSETYSTPPDLRAHMLIHEAEYDRLEHGDWKNTYICPTCPLTFSDQSSLRAHLSTHEPPPVNDESVQRELKLQRAAPLDTGNVPGRVREEDSGTTKPLTCPDCGKAFRHRSVLELHMRIHSKTKPYQCKVCHKAFQFNKDLQQHLTIHQDEKPYHKCPDCGDSFTSASNMKAHQKLHEEKPFRCTRCRLHFSELYQLQLHIRSHDDQSRLKCNICNETFGMPDTLRDHMNTHTGERPHRCHLCHKSFTFAGSLLEHQKIHEGNHQVQSQPPSSPTGIRIGNRGSRGRGDGRLSQPRLMRGSDTPMPQHLPQYQVPVSRQQETGTIQPQISQMDLNFSDSDSESQQEQWMSEDQPPPVQWEVEGGELRPMSAQPGPSSAQRLEPRLVQESGTTQKTQMDLQFSVSDHESRQQQERWVSVDQPAPVRWQVEGGQLRAMSSQPGPSSSQSLESRLVQECVTTAFFTKPLPAAVPKNSSVRVSESEQQRQPQTISWGTMPTPTLVNSSQHNIPATPNFLDGTALWGVKTSPAVPTSQSSTLTFSQAPQLPQWSGIPITLGPSSSGGPPIVVSSQPGLPYLPQSPQSFLLPRPSSGYSHMLVWSTPVIPVSSQSTLH